MLSKAMMFHLIAVHNRYRVEAITITRAYQHSHAHTEALKTQHDIYLAHYLDVRDKIVGCISRAVNSASSPAHTDG